MDRGLIPAYNALTDENLVHFFCQEKIRQHLWKSGLVTHDGLIVSEKDYRLNMAKLDHIDHVKRNLSSKEGYDTSKYCILQNKGNMKRIMSSISLGSNTSREKSEVNTRRSEKVKQALCELEKKDIEQLTGIRLKPGLSSFGLLVMVSPPQSPSSSRYHASRGQKEWQSKTPVRSLQSPDGSWIRPAHNSKKVPKPLRSSNRQNAVVTLIYLGKQVSLPCEQRNPRDDVTVYQQHCGGQNLCVYKGQLLKGERFQFVSHRNPGFGFSLNFSLNGVPVERLSTCCEYRHQPGRRLGSKNGYFGFVDVKGSAPCERCQIAAMCPKDSDTVSDPGKENKEDSSV
ncbi:glutamate-rich protein 3-like [Polypterus senegalus]|uniref:glutamate-rich protein 3-like n=1 Tax=Polypterus senegalus TaxID=55291 RepID=UPI0019660B05|nr:glutamate-rich protein 3-like [Polypterus senegalus]